MINLIKKTSSATKMQVEISPKAPFGLMEYNGTERSGIKYIIMFQIISN
jgi:hypothetical protein